ncbi:hypothetical protein HU200_044113 [Digitaria exilis]|uniref:Uncharacterized protein n=1 Tax=Digitaria exilis TaxID=1010633 RepID=A0A835BD80_9POAL|nr:hypothetical protein HU200_044113 [Digitaria exilis]
MVETDVRRSARVKGNNGGFKKSGCEIKGCLGCSASPPTLSMKAIGKSTCMISPVAINDESIRKKPKIKKVIQKKKSSKAPAIPMKRSGKKRVVDEETSSDDEA